MFVSSSSHCYGDRPRGRSYFGACWSHNRDGHIERRDVCTVSLHIQPVSHFILSFSQSVSHCIASVSRSVSQRVSQFICFYRQNHYTVSHNNSLKASRGLHCFITVCETTLFFFFKINVEAIKLNVIATKGAVKKTLTSTSFSVVIAFTN